MENQCQLAKEELQKKIEENEQNIKENANNISEIKAELMVINVHIKNLLQHNTWQLGIFGSVLGTLIIYLITNQ